MAKSNLKNINNYLFWKTPNYSYNFKQSNAVFFHYFFCLYIIVINFFLYTIIYKNSIFYNKVELFRLDYSNLEIEESDRLENFKKLKYTLFTKKLNIFKYIKFNNLKKKFIKFFKFNENYFFKKNLKKRNLIIYQYLLYFSKLFNNYNSSNKFIIKLNNRSINNSITEFNNNNIYNYFSDHYDDDDDDNYFYNYFFNIEDDNSYYIFSLKLFYINSELNIVLYFNKLNTCLDMLNEVSIFYESSYPLVTVEEFCQYLKEFMVEYNLWGEDFKVMQDLDYLNM